MLISSVLESVPNLNQIVAFRCYATWVGLHSVILVLPDHTHLLFGSTSDDSCDFYVHCVMLLLEFN